MCLGLCFHHHSQDTEFHHKDSSHCRFVTLIHLLQTPTLPKPWQSLTHSVFLKLCLFKSLFKWKNAVHNLLKIAVYHSGYFLRDSSKRLFVFTWSFSWLCSIPWCGWMSLVNHSSVDRHLSPDFQFISNDIRANDPVGCCWFACVLRMAPWASCPPLETIVEILWSVFQVIFLSPWQPYGRFYFSLMIPNQFLLLATEESHLTHLYMQGFHTNNPRNGCWQKSSMFWKPLSKSLIILSLIVYSPSGCTIDWTLKRQKRISKITKKKRGTKF